MDIGEQLSTKKESVDLRELYPLPHRIVFRRSWLWIVAYLFALALVLQRYDPTGDESIFANLLGRVSFYAIFFGLFLVCGKLLYEEFHRALYWYGIEASSAIVLYGVIVKHRTSLPLARVSDIYLERNFIDFLFGLYSLNFSTATAASLQHAKVHGLSRNGAVGLQDYLVDLIKSMHPEAATAVAETPTVDVPAEEHKRAVGSAVDVPLPPDLNEISSGESNADERTEGSAVSEAIPSDTGRPVTPTIPPNFGQPPRDPELVSDIEEQFGTRIPDREPDPARPQRASATTK